MAKKKRTGLDALREYEAGGESVASSTTSAVETGSSTKKNRTGLDALREYETTGAQNLVKDSPFDPNYRTRTAASYGAYQNALRERQEGEEKLKQITQTVNHDQQSGYLRTMRERQKQVEPTVIHDQISGYQRTEQERQKQREATEQWPHIQKDQERGKKRTSQELQKQIDALEEQRANSHFQDYQYDENGEAYTVGENGEKIPAQGSEELGKRIDALQQRKTLLDNERALTRAQEAMNGLDDETRQLLALYNRGVYMDIEPLETRKDAYQKLVAKGYSKERIGSLAEYEQRLQDYEDAQNRIQKFEEFGKNKNAQMTATLVSGLMAPFKAFGNIESVRGVLPSWAGGYQNEDMPTNIYSGYYAASQASGAIRQGVMQDMGEVGRFLYQAGTSALDSAVNMAVSVGLVGTFGLSGEAAQDAVANTMNWVMGSQVAADSVYEGIQNGKSNTDALIDGIVEGAIEGITEKYSVGDIIENMLGGRAVWKKMLRSFASEGAEEIASNWLNRVYDVVAKHDRSEVLAQYANYIAEGKTQVQALVAMAADFAKEDGLSFLAGGLSGISMSSVYAGANRVILETNVAQTARAVVEAGQVQDVIDYGLAQKDDTKAHKLAEAMQKTVDAGEEVTVQDAENVLREVAKEQQAAVDEGEEPRVPEKLTRMEQMQQNVAETAERTEQAAANAEQIAANTEQTAQKDSYQIYRENVQDIENRARQMDEMGRQYAQEETTKAQNAAEIVRQAKQKSEQAKAAESVLRPSETMAGVDEVSAEQFARIQTQEAAQELEEADARQTEEYLQQRAEKAGYDEATTSYFLSGNVTRLATEQYAEQFQTLYAQGQAGAGWQYAKRYAQGMNQDVAQAAWKAGLAAGQKGATDNGSQTVTGDRQGRNARERGGEPTPTVAEGTGRKAEANDEGRKRAQNARGLAKTWREVSCKELGLGEAGRGTVRVMPEGAEKQSTDIRQAAKYLKSMGVKNAQFFTGQLQQEINGEMVYAEGAVLEDGTVLIRADSEQYSAFQLARHEGYHILADRYPAMAERIRARLMNEGKITRQMVEGYIEAYHRAYGDNFDAYAEEILADAYAGMNRTADATTPLRMDVWTETGQWTKKIGSARAPPVKMSVSKTFADEIQNWYRSGMKTGASFVLGATGDTLQGLGAIESDIYMTGDKIRTILNDHPEMTINEIKRIPEILDDPVLILKSKNTAGVSNNSRLVTFGAVKARDGRPIMCVLDLRPTENGLLLDDMQKVTSAYTKDNNPVVFIQSSFVMHADEKRTIPLLRTIGFQMPITLQRSGSIGSITYKGPKVNLRGEKFSDVVKLGIESNETQTKAKFSMSSPTEQTKDFIAVHNKDWGTIRDAALRWGGIPSPSIAIVDAEEGHRKYGDTSVVYPRATIDPEASNKNKVYGGDAWTPTARNVIVEREVDYEARRNAERKFAQLAGKVAGGIFSRESVIGSHADEVTTMDEAELARTLAGDDTVRAAYLAEQGRDIEPVLKEKVWDSFGNQALRDYTQEIGAQKLAELYVKLETGERLSEQELETAKDSIMNAWISSHAYALNRKPELRERRITNQREKLSNARVEAFIRNAEALYENDGADSDEIDRYATQDKLREAVNDKDVETWVRGKIEGILGEPGIYNGKDRFTAAGRRKSFKELHGAYTAENIVQAMNQASERGEGYWGVGASGIVSVATPRYESVEAMHADEGRLQNVSQETYDRMLRELDSRIEQIVGNVQKTSGSYDMDEIAGLLMENAGKNAAQIQRAFNVQGYRLSEKVAAEIESMYRQAAQIPTGYFEAKPQRVVPFSEAAAIIAPDSAPQQEIEAVERATGANVLTYKEGDENQRLKLLNGLKGIRFSAAAQTEQGEQQEPQYVTSVRTDLLRDLQRRTGIPYVWGAEQVKEQTDALIEAAQTSKLTQEMVDAAFTEVWDAGKTMTREFAEQYDELLQTIRESAITPTEEERESIKSYEHFQSRAKGKIKLADEGGASIADTYRSLSEQLPSVFPQWVSEKQMAEFLLRGVQQMQSAKNLAKSFQSSNSTVWEERAKADFQMAVREMASDLRRARQQEAYVENRNKKRAAPTPKPESAPEAEGEVRTGEIIEDVAQRPPQQQAQEQQEKEATKSYRDVLPRKAAEYVRRLENKLVYELADSLSVPNNKQTRGALHEAAEKLLSEFFETGEISRAGMNQLFEQAWEAGMEESTEYYEQYKDLKELIRDQELYISEEDRADIADFAALRRAAAGVMRLSDGGLAVDSFYEQLREMAPELFPEKITAPSDQLLQILNVARSIQKYQWTLDQYWGDQAQSFKANQQAQFTEAVDRLVSGLRIAQRYREAQDKAAEKLAVPQSAEEAAKLYPELKEARKAYEKVQNRQLLTEEDRKVVNRLLRGETTPEYARTLENGEAIVQAYEAKAEFDMIALRLKAWNVQRKQRLRDAAEQALTEAEATKWVDKNAGIQYARETMERNVRDIARKGKVSDEKADAFNNQYFWPVHENESKRKNYLVQQQEKIRALDLSQKVQQGNLVSESYAVQWLGEAEFNAEYLQKHQYVKKRGGMSLEEWQTATLEFEMQNPKMDMKKIRSAVKVFHQVYDELFQEMNRVRVENGYEPVDYTFGYFPHFQENDQDGTLLQRFAKALGVQGDVTPLPATINGLTSTFKPGIRYMANIQKRLGYATAYDALKGMDQYLEAATDVIFHTEDIQRLRALATQIRYRASEEGIQQRIDAIMQDPYLSPEEAHDQVAKLVEKGKFYLSRFVAELDEYTNILAGKRSQLDRAIEQKLDGKLYRVVKKFESRVGANMVAANIGSALTNFIPITQAWAQTSTVDVLVGMWQTVKNMKEADGLDSMSSFINNRSGYDRLSVSNMDKASAIAGWLMETVDQFTTGSVVRARYLNNLKRGMSEINAMQEADQFAAAIMADRSKGSTPTLYSSKNPVVKLFTQFQLEVNNELSWIFKDMIPAERKKGVLALTKALFKFMIGAWIYNEIYEAIVGRRSALDPLDMINDTVGDFTGYHLPNMMQAGMDYLMRGEEIDFTTEKKKMPDAVAGLTGRVLSEFPGTQALTMLGLDEAMGIEIDNGRIAVASAIPDLGELRKAIWSSEEELSDEKRMSIFVNELSKPAQYVAMPFGGGQLNKMVRGVLATAQGGSYKVDNEGNDVMQYPVYNDTAVRTATSLAESLLFGKTATEAAREWVESGFRSLSVKETTAYQKITEAGEDQRKTYAFINAVKEVEKTYDKKMLIKVYNIGDEAKAEYYYHCIASEKQQAEMDALNGQERVQYVQDAITEAESDHNRDKLRKQVIAGTVTTEKAVQKLVANDWAKDENDAYWKVKEWQGGDGYKKYDAFLSDIEAGKDVEEAAKEYLEHGVEAKTLARQITTAYKAQYLAAEGKQREKLEEKLLDMYEALGFDRDEKSADIRSWPADEITKEYKERYIAADSRERAKMKPEILKAYVAIGYDRKERSRTIDGWVEDAKKK